MSEGQSETLFGISVGGIGYIVGVASMANDLGYICRQTMFVVGMTAGIALGMWLWHNFEIRRKRGV